MPIATPEQYAEMFDKAKKGGYAFPRDQLHLVVDDQRRDQGFRRRRQ